MAEKLGQGWTEQQLEEVEMLFLNLGQGLEEDYPNMVEFWKGWLELLGETEVSSVLVLEALKHVHPNSMHAFQPGEPGVIEVVVNHPQKSGKLALGEQCFHRFIQLPDRTDSSPLHLWVVGPDNPKRLQFEVDQEEIVESIGHTGQMHLRLYLKFKPEDYMDDLSEVFTEDLGWQVLVEPS